MTVMLNDMHTREQFLHFCMFGLDLFLYLYVGVILCSVVLV